MPHKRAHTLAPLTKLRLKKVKLKWNDVEKNSFIATKKIGHDVLLSYPKFRGRFIIHTDANKMQLRGVMSRNRKPIAFYSQKSNLA